jgi:3',5'-cyclic AMP phosphodiesterase CpdA
MTLPTASPFTLPTTGPATPWRGLHKLPRRPDEFTFVLLSDRTGLARPGVFERAVDITNLLRPDFALQLGDMIEGYTTDQAELDRQWAEFDAIADALEVPFFATPGNHDVSNDVMREHWLARHGALHYHFRYRDVLFVVLNTQDPPQPLEDIEPTVDWFGTMPARISAAQAAWAEQVINANADVRWTVLSMHMPAWQGDGHPALDRIRTALGDRPYTMFAGHTHNYRRSVIDGRDHIRLGNTGGVWVYDGDEGNWDHVTAVTVTPHGLTIANVVLDGVLGVDGGRFAPTRWDDSLPDP